MNRFGQYVLAVTLLGFAGALSYLGFVYTGGAVPWGRRFSAVMERGLEAGTGPLLQTGRGGFGGFLLAGPLRDDVGGFLVVLLFLVGASLGLYWWTKRGSSRNS